MINTENIELQTAKEIVTAGLTKAAESLSFFMKEPISLDGVNFNNPADAAVLTNKKGENINLLLTEIIGELNGICCLLFTEDEANKLRHAALPPEIINDSALMTEMRDGILLEVDNIISAAVITQFSNILNRKMHGGVPRIKKISHESINKFIREKLEKDMLIVNFNTHFSSSTINFSPQFIWLFDHSFSQSIANVVAQKQLRS